MVAHHDETGPQSRSFVTDSMVSVSGERRNESGGFKSEAIRGGSRAA
ncbi:hypothetical protein MINT15_16180 [Saccharomonospora viridis]|uniref:Uncharacterized protein n=1 Tax=Saccharomonospora viridis TaxID=1852 RepID=A0A837DFU6_9PSEU|nr:hypothetical protein MINT15_16180 [Saccharomonospora viridis]